MSIAVDLVDDPNVRIESAEVEPRAPDTVAFAVDGSISVGEALLGEFAGRTMEPESVAFAVEGDDLVVDLRDGAALRLETLDVGVEIPDAGDALSSAVDVPAGEADAPLGAVSFTVEGVIEDLDEGTAERLAGAPRAEPASITFSVHESLESDGGRGGSDRLAEFTLLDYGIVVRRDGLVTISGPLA